MRTCRRSPQSAGTAIGWTSTQGERSAWWSHRGGLELLVLRRGARREQQCERGWYRPGKMQSPALRLGQSTCEGQTEAMPVGRFRPPGEQLPVWGVQPGTLVDNVDGDGAGGLAHRD